MLFDTDVLIWSFRGDGAAQREIDGDGERSISVVTYMELMQGARNKQEQRLIREFLHRLGFEILPITENISHRASLLVETYALSRGLMLADALVFATACEAGRCLSSSNERHFREIPGLTAKVFRPELGR